MEPDDVQVVLVTWEDIFIPELAPLALATLDDYEDWELQVQIAATAIYASNFLNLN